MSSNFTTLATTELTMNSSESKLQLFKDGVAPPTAHSRRTGGPSPKLLILKGLALLMLLSAAACGSSGPGEPGGGQPGNPSVVDGGKTVCKLDTDCKRVGGICKKEKDAQTGVCANPEAGCQNTRCLVGYECDQAQNKCIESKCETPCARGVCSKTTENQCVSKSSCTVSGEATDCIEGMYCYVESGQTRGTCKTEGEIGDELGCGTLGAPGVYDPTRNRTACVDALRCQKDEQCTSRRCVKVGTTGLCEKDFCAPPDVCKDGGACMNDTASPTGYTCKSKATCESQSDCAKPDICIKENGSSSGQCKSLVDACSVGCSGKRVCSYDESASKVKCEESGSCDSNLDCNPGRICTAGSCVAGPATCPNDSTDSDSGNDQANAKKYIGVKGKTQYICGDDADYVKYEYKGSQPGTLIIRVVLDASNYQGRVIKLTVTDSSGDSVVATNKNGDGTLSRAFSVTKTNVPSNEEFTIGVMAEDGSALNHVAIGYQLSVTEVDAKSVDICKDTNIEELANDGTIKEGYFNGKTGIASSCVNVAGYFYSQVYKLEIDKRSYTSIQLAPDGGANLGLSVRRSCYDKLDEVPHGCVDKDSSGGTETFGEVLDPGMYYVVVTGNSVDQNASYHISAKSTETICTPTTVRECTSGGRIKMCGTTQTDWEYDDCNLKGCSVQGGQAVCNGPQGDTCANPEVVTAGHDIVDKKITLDPLRNSYVAGSTCVDVGPSKSSGKDYVFSAVVKPGEALAGTIKDPGGAKKSAYIVKDCSNLNTCLATASDKAFTKYDTEALSIFWKNTGATDETVFLVIDYEDPSDRPVPTEFTVNLRVGIPACEPRSAICPNGDKILFCNDLGTKYNGKPPVVCDCTKDDPNPTCKSKVLGDGCTNPNSITFSGDSFTTSVDTNTLTSKNVTQPFGCGSIPIKRSNHTPKNDSPDYILKLTPEAGKSYEIEVTPKASFKPVVWVAAEDSCNAVEDVISPSSCIEGLATELSSPKTLLFNPPDATKSYFIVVSSFDAKPGQFDITIYKKDKSYSPYHIEGCDTGEGGIVYGDKAGIKRVHKCACKNGSKVCDTPTNETCYDATLVYPAGTSKTGTLSGTIDSSTRNDIGKMLHHTPDDYHIDRCLFSPSSEETPIKGDHFYKFKLEHPDDLLVINFRDSRNALAPFFQEGDRCNDPDACFGTIGGRGTQTLSYVATKANDEIFFVVKYAAGALHTSTYDFDWHVYDSTSTSKPSCVPNSTSCDSADTSGKKVKVCNQDGTKETVYTCKNKCSGGMCLPTTVGETCKNAIDVGTGGVFLVDDELSTNSASPTCLGKYGKAGFDTYFKVYAKANQVIRASSSSIIEGVHSIYIFKDCSDIDRSCLVGADGTADGGLALNAVSVDYVAPVDGTYYIGITGDSVGLHKYYSGLFYVEIDVQDEECDATTATTCSSGVLTYCNNHKLDKMTCTCDGTSCSDHKGEICQMPIVLTPSPSSKTLTGESITHKKDQPQLELKDGISGNCMFAKNLSGPQKFYSIELEPNQTLKVSIENKSTSSSLLGQLNLYLLDGCEDTCLASAVNDGSGDWVRELAFTNHKSVKHTYLLVVDSTNRLTETTDVATYDLTYQVSSKSGECEPYTSYCKDSNTLVQCAPGKYEVEASCECLDGVCLLANDDADRCASAPLVPDGFSTIVPFATYTNNIEVESKSGVCDNVGYYGRGAIGHDAYFRFTVPKGRTLTVSSTNSAFDASTEMFVLDSCNPKACIADAEASDEGRRFDLTYTAGSSSKTIIVGISHSEKYTSADFPRTISFNLSGETCDPTSEPMVCSGGTLTYCSHSTSTKVKYSCDGSTCNSGNDGCGAPSGAICEDAKVLTLSGTPLTSTVSGDLVAAGLSNRNDLGLGNICTLEETKGNDIVYKIEVPAGKELTVNLASTASTKQDLALYVTKDCYKPDDASASCMGSDVSGGSDESVTVTNSDTTPTTYYIYVDSKTTISAGDGTFDLTATVQ